MVYNLGSAPTSLELEHGNFHSTHGDSDASIHTISQWHGWIFYFLSIDVCDGLVMVVFTFLLLCHLRFCSMYAGGHYIVHYFDFSVNERVRRDSLESLLGNILLPRNFVMNIILKFVSQSM